MSAKLDIESLRLLLRSDTAWSDTGAELLDRIEVALKEYSKNTEATLKAGLALMQSARDIRGADNVTYREKLPGLIQDVGMRADVFNAYYRHLKKIV
jgi:hypothetical protein